MFCSNPRDFADYRRDEPAQPRAWQDPRRQAQACQQIEELRRFCGPDMALLSVGGVQTADHLRARMSAGAELVQVHTAFMHQSPWLARRLLR
nr:hypothetical protein [Stutzerimonas stutzeri]